MNAPRPDRNQSIQFATWTRDAWHCRFCSRPVFFGPSLRELERLAPGHAYYHANGKTSVMLPLLADSWVAAHHLVSKTDGGESTPDNVVTSCMKCNTNFSRSELAIKRQSLREVAPESRALRWDGLAGLYPKLCSEPDGWCSLIAESDVNRPQP